MLISRILLIFTILLLFTPATDAFPTITQMLHSVAESAQRQVANAISSYLLGLLLTIGLASVASLNPIIASLVPPPLTWQLPLSIEAPPTTKDLAIWRIEGGLQRWISTRRWSPNWIVVTIVVLLCGAIVFLIVQRRTVTSNPPQDAVNVATEPTLPTQIQGTLLEIETDVEDTDPIVTRHFRDRTIQRPSIRPLRFLDDEDLPIPALDGTASEDFDTASTVSQRSDSFDSSNSTVTPNIMHHHHARHVRKSYTVRDAYDLSDPFIDDTDADDISLADSEASYTESEASQDECEDSNRCQDPEDSFQFNTQSDPIPEPVQELLDVIEEFITPGFTYRRLAR